MRLPRLGFWLACLGAGSALGAASLDDRVERLFRPLLGERMALSPDGLRVAYTVPEERGVTLVLATIEPAGAKRTVRMEPERDAPWSEGGAVALRYLRWAPNGRIVFAPVERVAPLPPLVDKDGRVAPNPDGPTVHAPIFVADAEGRLRGTLIDAARFQETPADARKSLADLLRTTKELQVTRGGPVRWRMPHLDILGFPPREPDQLIVRTHGAYSMPMQHLVDIRTGSVREFGGDWPAPPGEPHLFDPYRLKIVGERQPAPSSAIAWRDPELAAEQRALEAKFPRRSIEILDWSETRSRVLFRVTGGSDAGRVFVHQRAEDLVVEILQRAPWLNDALHETRPLAVARAAGPRASGFVTWPGKPRATPAPLVVVFVADASVRPLTAFDPEAQVLAELGFVVLRLPVGGDVSAEARTTEEARGAVETLAGQRPERGIDRRCVIALGRGAGGLLALRAAQLQPLVFRGVIKIGSTAEVAAARSAPESAAAPVPPTLVLGENELGATAASPAARVAGYRKIAEFLETQASEASVRIGPLREMK